MCENARVVQKKVLYLDGGCLPAASNALGTLTGLHLANVSLDNFQSIALISGGLTGGISVMAGLPIEEAVKLFVHTDISKLFTWKQNFASVTRRWAKSIWANPAAQLENALYGLLGSAPLGEFYDKLFAEKDLKIPENFLTMTVNGYGGRTVITGKGISIYHQDGSRHEIARPPRKIGSILRGAITVPWLIEARLLRNMVADALLDTDVLKDTPCEHDFALDGGLVHDPTDTVVEHCALEDKRGMTVCSSTGLRSTIPRHVYFFLARQIPGLPRLEHCDGFDPKQLERLILTTVKWFGLLNFKASPRSKLRGILDACDAMIGRLDESNRPTAEEQRRYKNWLIEFAECGLPAGYNPYQPGSRAHKRWIKRHRVA